MCLCWNSLIKWEGSPVPGHLNKQPFTHITRTDITGNVEKVPVYHLANFPSKKQKYYGIQRGRGGIPLPRPLWIP